MPYKVMLVDDDSLVRRGLKSFVDWEKKGLVLAGEAADGGKALELLESLRPDIVITDMYMPNYNGLKFIQEAQASFPDLLFIVLSCHNDIHYVKESMRLGAFDYLLKSSIVDSDELDVVLDKAVASLDARSQRNGAELWEAERLRPNGMLLSLPARQNGQCVCGARLSSGPSDRSRQPPALSACHPDGQLHRMRRML